ncbi:hypothetical protein DK058_24975 [Salmonella enterica subsp. enterica serovar Typhi]|nr:hypothetical protein [Salmonella enterica subsp. enterica serovar Typhi]
MNAANHIPETIVVTGAFSDWTLAGLRDFARRADQAGVKLIVLPDAIAPVDGGEAWPDALIVVGWLAAATERVRLAGAISSLGHQPYNLARRLASLELISGGRAGWFVIDGADAERTAYSAPQRLDEVDLAERQAEFEDVVAGLWSSWDANALVHDRAAGQFFRPDAMHTLDHEGKHFAVRGPLNVMRSPRGAPDLLHASDLAGAITVSSLAAGLAILGETAP